MTAHVEKKVKLSTIEKPMTKAELVGYLADRLEMRKVDIVAVLDELADVIHHHLGKKGPGMFTLHNLLKIEVVKKAAVKAKEGVNPFTKEAMIIPAKPASKKVKIKALKHLKDLVAQQ
ncbi:MAG: DNA-binding protein [Gammaproteobacteria bacterium]|nr:DNA-binding protein [Gammaproteobacteria bacterium]